ncbi:MAG: hypothetical protein ACI8W8_000806 [Rhodothermales bacterium]|jgi:hypothetical protein
MTDDDAYCAQLLASLEDQAPDQRLEDRLLAGLQLVAQEEESRSAVFEDRRLGIRLKLCVLFTALLLLRGLLAPWSAGIEDTAAAHLGRTGEAAWKMAMATPRYMYLAGPQGIDGNHTGIVAFVHAMSTQLMELAIWVIWMLYVSGIILQLLPRFCGSWPPQISTRGLRAPEASF